MPQFFDLHCHMLAGADDGAKNAEEMFSMLEMAYEDGIRAICLTPHYSPYLFGNNVLASERSYAELKEYVAEKHPDMQIFLGNELGYHQGCVNELVDGRCRTLNNSRYVLMDFSEGEDFFSLSMAVNQVQRAGYFVILAHAERYRCLFHKFRWFESFVDEGGIIQINASSCCGGWGKPAERQCKKLLRHGLVHMISSDGHNLTTRQPKISVCMPYLERHFDEETIGRLVWENARRVCSDGLISAF